MMPTIVWDMDQTFWASGSEVLHPDTELLLRRSRRDFGRVILWTFSWQTWVDRMFEKTGLDKAFFDDIYTARHPITKESRKDYFKTGKLKKDLTLLGNPEEFVMVENDGFAVPEYRRIMVPSFVGQDSDLRTPYLEAYLLMYFPDEYRAMTEEQRLTAAQELERGYATFRDREL